MGKRVLLTEVTKLASLVPFPCCPHIGLLLFPALAMCLLSADHGNLHCATPGWLEGSCNYFLRHLLARFTVLNIGPECHDEQLCVFAVTICSAGSQLSDVLVDRINLLLCCSLRPLLGLHSWQTPSSWPLEHPFPRIIQVTYFSSIDPSHFSPSVPKFIPN